jgi:phosphonate transport system substrate-binding protein
VKSQIASQGTCVAIAMRDSDRDLTTKIIVHSNSQFSSLADLKGKTIAVGASDSPQATLIPLNLVAEFGLDPFRDCKVLYHNVMVGKHGDHVGGERDAARALASGAADAACVLDANYGMFVNEGTLDPGTTRTLATTPPFDHCNFTARASLSTQRWKPFADALLGMSFQHPEVRVFMEMEGLKRWLPARTTGYAQLEKAVERFHFYGGTTTSAGT